MCDMFGEREKEGDASNWEISLNYYKGAFTLEESKVVLVKGYPSQTHARTRTHTSPPILLLHPCLLPLPTKKNPSPSSLPPPPSLLADHCIGRWDGETALQRAVSALSCVWQVRVWAAAVQVRCVKVDRCGRAVWSGELTERRQSTVIYELIWERAPGTAALCIRSRGGLPPSRCNIYDKTEANYSGHVFG